MGLSIPTNSLFMVEGSIFLLWWLVVLDEEEWRDRWSIKMERSLLSDQMIEFK